MKNKDIIEKILLGFNDVFADVVNGAVFDGKDVVKSEELSDVSPVTQFKDDESIHREQIRDVAKLWEKKGVIFSFIGIENQTNPDKDMILRVISYDGATYKSQIGNEHIYPVFTIVIYWGKSEWKAPTTLKDRLDCPDELIDIVSDHKFKLIDMVRLSDEDIEKYKGDFNLIAGIIGNPDRYEPENREIKHPEVVLDAVIGDERFGEIKDEIVNIIKEWRKVDMCEFLDKIENRGVEKGRLEGKIEGKIEGRNEGEELATFRIAKNFKDSKVDVEIIVKATGLTKEQIEAL